MYNIYIDSINIKSQAMHANKMNKIVLIIFLFYSLIPPCIIANHSFGIVDAARKRYKNK